MTAINFYNSLSKKSEPLTTKNPKQVRIYNCGPTVYKRQHIGNMRRYLFADFLRRSLELLGYEVKDIMNITDVGHLTQDEIDQGEDKLSREAKLEHRTPQDIAREQTANFMADLKTLNIEPASLYPRATDHVEEMQNLIGQLIERGHAYATKTGIYFDMHSFPKYGQLSGNSVAELEAGKRVEVREDKKHPADFALWIFDKDALQKWDSPWGEGFPGWHIECSAMSLKYLGTDIDIHTGGEDNKFPHHENEIAQSEGATGERFVRIWMHNRHLKFGGKKMAKREGEVITLDTIAERGFSPLALRLMVFAAHYRSLMDFSWEGLAAAAENLKSITSVMRRLKTLTIDAAAQPDQAVLEKFQAALASDLNTPEAFAVLMDYIKQINVALESATPPAEASKFIATLKAFDKVVGVIEPIEKELESETIPAEIQKLAHEREDARSSRDFKRSDALRDELAQKGYTVEDTPAGPRIIRL